MGKRIALVIGNSAYDKPLSNPVRDAAIITAKLEKLGFEVVGGSAGGSGERRAGENLGFAEMQQLIGGFEERIEPGDEALIYYAGHGLQIADKNYLLPIGVDLDGANPLLQLVELRKLIVNVADKAGQDGVVLVFLDACRVNPFSPHKMREIADKVVRSLSVAEAGGNSADHDAAGGSDEPVIALTRGGLSTLKIARDEIGARTFIAFATAPGEVAFDGDPETAQNSPFAAALARHIDVRGLEIEDFYDRVAIDVQDDVRAFNQFQDPWSETNLNRRFYFNPGNARPLVELAIGGVIAGTIIAFVLFERGLVASPIRSPWVLGLGGLMGLVLGYGTLRWGSGRVIDAILAFLGPTIGFALAVCILQLPNFDSKFVVPPADDLRWRTGALFRWLAVGTGVLMLIGAAIFRFTPSRYRRRQFGFTWLNIVAGLTPWLAPFFVVGGLFSLQYFLSFQNPLFIALALLTLLAGVVYALSTAVACTPQGGLFAEFSPATGAVAVGLTAVGLAALYIWASYRWSIPQPDTRPMLIGLSALWHGLLGAQMGYCFAYYVPAHIRRRARRPAKR